MDQHSEQGAGWVSHWTISVCHLPQVNKSVAYSTAKKVSDVSISGEAKKSGIKADQNGFEEGETSKRRNFLNSANFVMNSEYFC